MEDQHVTSIEKMSSCFIYTSEGVAASAQTKHSFFLCATTEPAKDGFFWFVP